MIAKSVHLEIGEQTVFESKILTKGFALFD